MNKQQIIAWKQAAIADGWSMTPVSKNETTDTWCHLERDGFRVQVVTRPAGLSRPYIMTIKKDDYKIALWGPDELAIEIPEEYSWTDITHGVNVCSECGKECTTVRLAFANRVCPECREKLKAKYEAPGWCD